MVLIRLNRFKLVGLLILLTALLLGIGQLLGGASGLVIAMILALPTNFYLAKKMGGIQYNFKNYKLKQSDKNWIIAMVLSLIVNYFMWYYEDSPLRALVYLFGLEDKLIWFFIWFTLVGGGFGLLILNFATMVKKGADK